jgi:hypothetical protein
MCLRPPGDVHWLRGSSRPQQHNHPELTQPHKGRNGVLVQLEVCLCFQPGYLIIFLEPVQIQIKIFILNIYNLYMTYFYHTTILMTII